MNDKAVAVREEPKALTPAQQRTDTIRRAMVERLPNILPNGMKPERFEAVTIQAIAKNPDLLDCDPTSVVMAVLEAAQLGLEPTGSLSRAWLVPYRSKDHPKPQAQLMIGYAGLVDLARRSGEIAKLVSRVVYEGDDFAAIYGSDERIHHIPLLETTDPTKITHVYAIATLRSGELVFDVMTKQQVDGIRARSRSANRGPWVTDYAEMARKTVVRRLVKSLPLTAEVMDAIERDAEREFGHNDAEVKVTESRTATVRGMLTAKAAAARGDDTAQDAPGAPETDPVASTSAPAESASQRTEPEPMDDVEGVEATTVCGAESDPKLGDVMTCVLEPDHKAPSGKPSPHKSGDGSVWPNSGD